MLAVDGQELGPAKLHVIDEDLARGHEAFLVREGHPAALRRRGERRFETGRPDDGRHHAVGGLARRRLDRIGAGGNPDVGPESADTYTFGVVWQPSGVGDGQFRMALDWFNYELEDVIGSVGAASIVSRCFNDQGANPT